MKKSEFTQAENAMIEQEFASLIDAYAHTSHRQHVERIEQAFRFANKAHYGVRRLSGEPYIMHPLAVAKIVVSEIGLGSTSISAALLHDVVEDTDYTVEDIDNLFGAKIAQIVDGLTKISGGVFGDKASEQAENFRKLLLTMSDDIRVVLIKIADRLHNMRTLSAQPIEKQYKIAGETQYIYAPLAHRLGLGSIKSELENLAFKYEHPDTYAELKERIEADRLSRMESFERFAEPIREKLTMLGYDFDLTARIKTPYSIWAKMNTKHVSFDEIYDLLAVRIVFTPNQSLSEKDQCWMIYSAITEIYRPHPGRIRDWISTPKANGYEALHVTVMGRNGEWVEIQIRTRRMHELAEQGLAAHWKYKTGVFEDTELDKWLRDIKEILASDSPDAMAFLDTFKLNLFAKEVFVFTPKGEIQTLPQGATVLDLAYQLHSELGEHCIGAKVNHNLQSSDYVLHAGDQVEVLTAEQQQPQPEWLNYAATAKAQSALNTYFRKQERLKEQIGERRLEDALRTLLIPEEQFESHIQRLQNYYHLTKRGELYKQVGLDAIKLDKLNEILFPKQSLWSRLNPWKAGNQQSAAKPQQPSTSEPAADKSKSKARKNIVLTDENLKDVILEECCKPIPGDEVIGFKDSEGKMHIHYLNCPVAERLKSSYGKSIYSVTWDTHRMTRYKEKLEIEGIDQFGLLIEILRVISDHFHINVHELHITANNGVFSAKIQIYVYDKAELYELIDALKKMHNIQSVKRVFT
ncbi:MAG: bifunctional (p)ppGpp synthetase/guanosine-3',5'-bis(diphosphate) 3'-pyrophosphohydrolase [Paludibacteraceae bacterium]|jgi:(p)ppGpp synthetase, RelA/SpoT family|nr:bifunctional (p)ppGpp synthetase/guanosine-3',5'-bis(diphosphate) 3'-pyrophosphohydrolase [Paludibacteraceae bacterium]